jgi:hypothetical protein
MPSLNATSVKALSARRSRAPGLAEVVAALLTEPEAPTAARASARAEFEGVAV